MDWSERNPGKIHPIQIARADFTQSKSLDEMVDHFLKEHDGNIKGLRERFAHGRVTLDD